VATSAEALSSLTVPELKARCREQGLLVGGKKADLIARLSEANSLVAKAGGSGSSSPALVKVHTYTWDPTDTSKAGAAALSPESRDALIAAREAARRGKDFATADSALAELRAAGIGVDDATR